MKQMQSFWWRGVCLSLAAAGVSFSVFAQPKPAGNGARAGGGAAAKGDPFEDKVMSALASREMDALLAHYFQKHGVSAEKQGQVKSIVAIREIANPALAPGKRRALLLDAVKGVPQFVESTKDTEVLMGRANLFIEHGMKAQINQIEYFGESPTRQSELGEAANAVMKLLDKSIEECEIQQNDVLKGQVRPNQALMNKWQTLDDRLQTAKWTRAFSAYGLALSMDPANPKRKEVAEAALVFLKDFESPDYQREVPVKMQMGKLLMMAGNADAAVKKFDEAAKHKSIDKFGQYEVRFYTTLANLITKKDKAAAASLDELKKWVGANLQGNELKAVATGVGLLDYRVNDMRAAVEKDAVAKKKFNTEAEAALTKVMKDDPRLEPVIKKMLLEKLPADADITKLDTVLLRSLQARGVDEVLRAKEGLVAAKDKPIVERAIAACQEIEKRKGQPNVTDDIIDEAAFMVPIFESKLGKATEAVEASLHYLKEHGKNKDRAATAIDTALSGVEVMRKGPDATSERVGSLIDRTWAIAVNGGRKEYAFLYGKRLFDQKKFGPAATVLALVPENNPAVTHARFFQLSAVQERLDDPDVAKDPAMKKKLVGEIQKLAGEVSTRIDTDLAKATENQKPRLLFYRASATLLAADLMENEQKDHAGVLKLLEGFEEKVKGLPKEENLIGTALHLRVNALMALNKTPEAVAMVMKLVDARKDQKGGSAGILFNMIQKMDEQYQSAKTRGDEVAMTTLSSGTAALIRPLIDQTKDQAAKEAYERWEADLYLRASRNEKDETKKKEFLAKAQKVFDDQLTKLLEKTKEGPAVDNLKYKLALVSFELKDYKKVQTEMGTLVANGKLGPPDIRELDAATNMEEYKENPVYWEGLLRYMQANQELSKTDNSAQMKEAIENNRAVLRALYINRGKNVGGERLRDEYALLKAALLPGWTETAIPATQAATKPSTASN